jgi:capsular exopolysaccharide synthesis family protein
MSSSISKQPPVSPAASQLPVPGGADPTYFLPKIEPSRILSTILRRGWIVVLLALVGAVALYVFSGRLPKIYRSTGSVYVSSQAPLVLDIRAVAPEETRDLEEMRSVELGMTSTSLLQRLIEKNRLADDPSFAPAGASDQTLLGVLAGRVKVELVRGTRLIEINVDDTDAERAKALVESLVAEYEAWTAERQQAITLRANEGLAREEKVLRERMESSAQKLQEFRLQNSVSGIDGLEGGPLQSVLATLSSQLTEATAARLRLESEFEAFTKFDSSNPEALAGLQITEIGTEVLAQIKAIQQKESEFARVKERYLFKHPAYIEVANEIALMKTTLDATVRAAGEAIEQRYAVAKENELKLASEVARARESAVAVEGVREKFRRMSREAEADRTLHDSVALRVRETSLAASVPASVLRWESSPLVPEFPRSPRKIIFAAVGAFAGLLGGMVILVGLELGNRKVRGSAAAAQAAGAPLLASLPQMSHSGDGMILLSEPSSAGAEAFRRLRAVLAPPPGSTTARTILFASAKSGEGKSFCALNYAASLAMQGHRTLLLDADLRRPGLSREHLVGAAPDSGLGGYLAGKIEPAEACFTTSLPNLYMMSSGPMRTDAAELLAGTRFPSLLEDAYRWFDRVVIDAPPVLSVSDCLAITRYADRTCLVVRDRGSDRRELKRGADLIRSSGGTLVGFVWNEASDHPTGIASPGPGVRVNRPGIASSPPVGVPSAKIKNSYEIAPIFA